MKNIKIFVSHRLDIKSIQIPNPIFINVLCGAYRPHKENRLIGDNTGDNISKLQPYFSELTVQYWAWKNLQNSRESVRMKLPRTFSGAFPCASIMAQAISIMNFRSFRKNLLRTFSKNFLITRI